MKTNKLNESNGSIYYINHIIVKPKKLIDPKHLKKQAFKRCNKDYAQDMDGVVDSNKTTHRLRQDED